MNIKKIWKIAIVIGVLSGIPIAIFGESKPWLISVPIVFGAVFILLMDLFPRIIKPQFNQTMWTAFMMWCILLGITFLVKEPIVQFLGPFFLTIFAVCFIYLLIIRNGRLHRKHRRQVP